MHIDLLWHHWSFVTIQCNVLQWDIFTCKINATTVHVSLDIRHNTNSKRQHLGTAEDTVGWKKKSAGAVVICELWTSATVL
jgi:hypothetical protein